MLKMPAIQERYLTPKGKTLYAQVVEIQKFKYDKIQNSDPRRVSDKWFEETFRSFFYKCNDKFLNCIAYDLLFRGINRMAGKTRAPPGNKIINFYCALAQRYPATVRLVLVNINGLVWNNIQRISKIMNTAKGSPIIARSNKEAIIFFFNEHKCHFKKDEKVAATVSIDATKHYEVLIANKLYQHFVGGAHPNHYIPFLEDGPDGANKREKLE